MKDSYRKRVAQNVRDYILHEMHGEMPELAALLAEFDALERENEELKRKVENYEALMTEGEKARSFLASVPFETVHSRNLRDTNPELKAKIDEAFYAIQGDDVLWYGVKDLPHEIWHDVKGYESRYQGSNLGRVKSFARGERILRGKIGLGVGNFWRGYLVVFFTMGGKEEFYSVHNLVANMFIPNPEDKLEVNHRYGVKMDNRVSELEWATRSENVKCAYDLGIWVPHNRKLSRDEVFYIRENPDGLTMKQLAEMFCLSVGNIYRVRTFKSYKNVK